MGKQSRDAIVVFLSGVLFLLATELAILGREVIRCDSELETVIIEALVNGIQVHLLQMEYKQ